MICKKGDDSVNDNSGKRSISDEIYGDIYTLGEGYRHFFSSVCKKSFSVLFRFIKKIVLILFGCIRSYARHLGRYFRAVAREGKQFLGELRKAIPHIREEFNENKNNGIKLFFRYVIKAFKVHEKFNRAVLSTVIPVFAVIFLISFYIAFSNLTFAVDVYVDGKCVGTVKDEIAYKDAQTLAEKRFSSTGSELSVSVPEYKISLTTFDNIDDTETVCDNVISAVSENTVRACGVYVNGEYLCAVKSEDTFNRVTEQVLTSYAEEHGFVDSNCTVEFDAEVTTVSGLYPDNEKVMSADEFRAYLTGYSTKPVEHTVSANESIDEILDKYNITEQELLSLNVDLNRNYIPEGSVLLITQGVKNISIKATRTYTKIETTDFDSVMQYDNNLYIGTTLTIVAGIPGRDVVSYTDTYVDGVLVSRGSEISRYNANDPVNELVKIGTLGVPVGDDSVPVSPRLTRDQGGTFVWPAPDNCYWLSQAYNPYRSHYGIDIVSSDGSSCKGRRIVAAADGVVVLATYHYSWGYYIRVDHGSGVVTGYAHALQGSFRVNVGDYVKAGQHLSSIGTTGNSTGYHLHFEVWLDGVRVDPLPYVYSEYTGIAIK